MANATPSADGREPSSTEIEQRISVREIAGKLSAHGVGPAALDLAFDLVLHEVVEQARDATQATGAAVALIRSGEMVCRATAGENAPDLGVRVETASGLAGACLSSGTIQECQDTETDSRVNAEVCRLLGVRSMLIAPLIDEGKVFGILQVFSARPNAFTIREMDTLQLLAQRIAEARREADISPPSLRRADSLLDTNFGGGPEYLSVTRTTTSSHEMWSAILVVLVIATAVLLGILIGWRGGFKERRVASQPAPAVAAQKLQSSSSPSRVGTEDTAGSAAASKSDTDASHKTLATSSPAEVPAGGLLVTQDGKVIYRSPASSSNPATTHPAHATRLIRRVEPEYPAEARMQHIQGSVALDVQVLGNGQVGQIVVISGDPLLAQAAVRAVKQWRFEPSLENGQPVESQTRVNMNFTLPST